MKKSIVVVAILVLFLSAELSADTLYLKSGKTYEGKLLSDSGGIVKWKTSFGVLEFPKDQVDRIEKGLTKSDEYKSRLAKLEDDDLLGRLELVRWCSEQKLFSQKKKLLRAILKACPDHPGARKESGQIWRGGKWVKSKDVPSAPVTTGKKAPIPESRGSVAVPEGWARKNAPKSVTATGPDNYASAPVLTIELVAKMSPAAAFPDGEGWEEPVALTVGGLSGQRSRRPRIENMIDHVDWLTVLSGGDHTVRIHLTCLECEAGEYGKALDVALESLEFAAPPADFVNKDYGYQLNLPKPKEAWSGGSDDPQLLLLTHQTSDPTDFALLMIVAGKPGDDSTAVKELFNGMVEGMKQGGDIEKDEEVTLSGEKARRIQGTALQQGIPVRQVAYLIEHGGRTYMIHFMNHEFGGAKTDAGLKTVTESFRFIK